MGDFITLDKPIEAQEHVGIDSSFTCLTDNHLFFSNEHYLMSATDGIKHFDNAYFISHLLRHFSDLHFLQMNPDFFNVL